uniref:Uncharacterized protein n=1 Tax=viral metagenome TaxID=1070528 RepID=A0A6C0L564_9ZZZZ|tara:strand:+ start:5848 stop:6111 length:264 start_codon:yes stop_codon:yes gene_type:complete
MDNDETYIYLLANPYHIKKKTSVKNDTIEEEIISLLQIRYDTCEIPEKYKSTILSKIETICQEYSSKHIIETIVNNIVTYAIERSYE